MCPLVSHVFVRAPQYNLFIARSQAELSAAPQNDDLTYHRGFRETTPVSVVTRSPVDIIERCGISSTSTTDTCATHLSHVSTSSVTSLLPQISTPQQEPFGDREDQHRQSRSYGDRGDPGGEDLLDSPDPQSGDSAS